MPDDTPAGAGGTPEQPIDPAAAAAPTGGVPAPDPAADPFAAALGGDDPLAGIDQASIDELLKQASFDDPVTATGAAPAAADPMAATAVAEIPGTAPMQLPDFHQVMQDAQVSSIDLLRDVDLNVKIELGRSRMLVEDVLKLAEGSVVELDKLAGDPVDVFVNDRLVARGEVLVLNDNFCVRINEIVAGVREEGL